MAGQGHAPDLQKHQVWPCWVPTVTQNAIEATDSNKCIWTEQLLWYVTVAVPYFPPLTGKSIIIRQLLIASMIPLNWEKLCCGVSGGEEKRVSFGQKARVMLWASHLAPFTSEGHSLMINWAVMSQNWVKAVCDMKHSLIETPDGGSHLSNCDGFTSY